jgi:hypothetical protein
MTDVKTILDMIESVSPEDYSPLDEIDCRVWCYLHGYKFGRMVDEETYPWEKPNFYAIAADGSEIEIDKHCCSEYSMTAESYTRSRDVLKAIRPEGWCLETVQDYGSGIWACQLTKASDVRISFSSTIGAAKTEELAEIHAILQAIEWERKNG